MGLFAKVGTTQELDVAVPGNATYATVFRERVRAALDPTGRCTEAALLGHAIAHELGHLLLGTSAHTRAGLMAGRWHASDLDDAAFGWLQFSPPEAARIRAEAIRRGRWSRYEWNSPSQCQFSGRPE